MKRNPCYIDQSRWPVGLYQSVTQQLEFNHSVIFLPSFKGLYIMLLEAKSFIVQHNVVFIGVIVFNSLSHYKLIIWI